VPGSGLLQSVYDSIVFLYADAQVARDFAQQWANYDLCAVVRNDNHMSLRIFEGVMAILSTLPLKTCSFNYLL